MNKNLTILIVCILAITHEVTAQDEQPHIEDNMYVEPDSLQLKDREKNIENEERIKTNLQVGTSFAHFSGMGYGTSFYLAPSVDYKLNKDFSIVAGMWYIKNNTTLNTDELGGISSGPNQNLYLFGGGAYKVSENLTISGLAYKSLSDAQQTDLFNAYSNLSRQGGYLHFDYKLSPSISIGLHFDYSERSSGSYPYYPLHTGWGIPGN